MNEMIAFLQRYIQINTAHPNPDYAAVLRLFEEQAKNDGFETERVVLPSGNTVLVISVKGTDVELPALLLNHHMDVVPAPNVSDWVIPPFAGGIRDGAIVGRGVQDMKGIGVLHYFALKEFLAQHKPKRTIFLVVVPDEEQGGFKGTKEFIETDFFKKMNVGYVLDEGHSSGNPEFLYIKIGERKPLQIRITCNGALAHGSTLDAANPIHELVELLHHIVKQHKSEYNKLSEHEAGMLLSLHITSFQAGIFNDGVPAINTIPDSAQALLDIRVPPSMKLSEVEHQIKTLVESFPTAHYIVEATVDEILQSKDSKNVLYHAIESVAKRFNLAVKPHIFQASSDLRYYLARGIEGVGFSPFTIADNIHGTNESIPIAQLERGKALFCSILENFCKELP